MNQEHISNLISEAESLSTGDLGPRFVRKERRRGQLLVHQSVATMLLAKANLGDVTFWMWDRVTEKAKKGKLQSEVLKKDSRVIIMLASTVAEAPGLSLPSFYKELRSVLATSKRVSIFPSRTESRWENEKI